MDLKDKFKNNEILQEIIKAVNYKNCFLVGGAVIDILEDRIPKDYDIIGFPEYKLKNLIDNNFKYICETKTAYTYLFKNKIIQFLKTDIKDFEYKISQSKYQFDNNVLVFDEVSFNEKILIPTTFNSSKIAKECLFRIPHYKRKGYDIHDMTFLSLLNVALNDKNDNYKS